MYTIHTNDDRKFGHGWLGLMLSWLSSVHIYVVVLYRKTIQWYEYINKDDFNSYWKYLFNPI